MTSTTSPMSAGPSTAATSASVATSVNGRPSSVVGVSGDIVCEIDLVVAGDLDLLEASRRTERLGGVETHLGGDGSTFGGRVELVALGAGDQHQVTIGPEAGGDGPFDVLGVEGVYVVVDHDDLLDVPHGMEGGDDRVLAVSLVTLADTNHGVELATATRRDVDCFREGKDAPQCLEHHRLVGHAQQVVVLGREGDQALDERPLPTGDGLDGEDGAFGQRTVVAGELGEGP